MNFGSLSANYLNIQISEALMTLPVTQKYYPFRVDFSTTESFISSDGEDEEMSANGNDPQNRHLQTSHEIVKTTYAPYTNISRLTGGT